MAGQLLPDELWNGKDNSFGEDYFYFDMRVVFGGHWRMLSAVQRAIYLAVAVAARSHSESPTSDWLIRDVLDPSASTEDMVRQYEDRQRYNRPHMRLACLSYSELSRISGCAESAVKKAVRGFKAPELWPVGGG